MTLEGSCFAHRRRLRWAGRATTTGANSRGGQKHRAVEAGSPFALLIDRARIATERLDVIRRQRDQRLRETVLEGRVNGRQLQNVIGRGGEDLAAIRRAVSALLSPEMSRVPLRGFGHLGPQR
jgi:predicted RNA-binding protein YlqC (UPF0109 family)